MKNLTAPKLFTLVFGLFLTSKTLDMAHRTNPIADAVAATQRALQQNYTITN